jgi:hypothetical protein
MFWALIFVYSNLCFLLINFSSCIIHCSFVSFIHWRLSHLCTSHDDCDYRLMTLPRIDPSAQTWIDDPARLLIKLHSISSDINVEMMVVKSNSVPLFSQKNFTTLYTKRTQFNTIKNLTQQTQTLKRAGYFFQMKKIILFNIIRKKKGGGRL